VKGPRREGGRWAGRGKWLTGQLGSKGEGDLKEEGQLMPIMMESLRERGRRRDLEEVSRGMMLIYSV